MHGHGERVQTTTKSRDLSVCLAFEPCRGQAAAGVLEATFDDDAVWEVVGPVGGEPR